MKLATLNNRKRNVGCGIEEKLLSLTIDVLTNPGVQDALERNGACRAGKPLARWPRWKSREASIVDACKVLSVQELWTLVEWNVRYYCSGEGCSKIYNYLSHDTT